MAHEVAQVDGPHALRELQLPACSLKVLLAYWMEVPARLRTGLGDGDDDDKGLTTYYSRSWELYLLQDHLGAGQPTVPVVQLPNDGYIQQDGIL